MSDHVKALGYATRCLDDYIEVLTKRVELVKTYAAEQQIAVEFVQAFPEGFAQTVAETGSDGAVSTYVPYSSVDTRVSFTLDAGTVQALMINKDFERLADVTETLKWLAARLGKYDIEDYPEMNRRSYVFSKGRLRFQCFFGIKDAAVCRFVKVGVKEEPVYQLQCDGQAVELEGA